MIARIHLLLAATLTLPTATLAETQYADVVIKNVPHVRQRVDFCGEACAEMALKKLGKRGDQDYVFNMSNLDPRLGRGCYSADLMRSLQRIGFQTGNVFYSIDAAHADTGLDAQWKLLHADLLKGIPSIVCMHYDDSPDTTEHMRLVVGYDSKSHEVLFHEPAEARGAYLRMKLNEFLALWPLKYERTKWLVIRFRMEPTRIKEPGATEGFSNADFAHPIIELKKRLPAGLNLCIERPFIVVGDGPPTEVEAIAQDTVRWAVDRLKRDYFKRDPEEIITIWLFKDDASYRRNTKQVFGDEPTTPYGYYSADHRALIMNIATGTGTLVHEIVHPYVRANFPKCPAWFNEGLGSLYEQCGERDGHIIGHTNWRLAGLQRAIKADELPSFAALCSTTDREFYGDSRGTNYAQARYLCYYLQEQGKLTQFYRDFVVNQKTDPTGYKTLVKTLGEPDMKAFQTNWETFVMGLKFP
jgi:hypothetical protein